MAGTPTAAGTRGPIWFGGGKLILVNEVARLADACAERAATPAARREAQRASVLVQASIAALTDAASKQVRSRIQLSRVLPSPLARFAVYRPSGVFAAEPYWCSDRRS
jgi:hypothetical protein